MSRTRWAAGWVLIVVAVVVLVVTYYAAAAPVTFPDGSRGASVWTVHRTHGRVSEGGAWTEPERLANAQAAVAAGADGWTRVVWCSAAVVVCAVSGVLVLTICRRRRRQEVGAPGGTGLRRQVSGGRSRSRPGGS